MDVLHFTYSYQKYHPVKSVGCCVATGTWADSASLFCSKFIGNYITYYWLAIILLSITDIFVLANDGHVEETPR